MKKTYLKLIVTAVLSGALLAGCGGGGGSDDHAGNGNPGLTPGPVTQTVTDVVAYISNLIAGTSDSAEPVDINDLTLTADNTGDAAPLP